MCRKQTVNKQLNIDQTTKDYGYIEYLRKSIMNAPDSSQKESLLLTIKFHEAKRDYFSTSLRQVNHLLQIDEKPNLELMEPKWELYKVSISFQRICEFKNLKLTWV